MSKNKITVESSGESDIISAFAYNTGRIIEKLIAEETDNLKARCQLLEAKILDYSRKTTDLNFKEYFGIMTMHGGNTKSFIEKGKI